MSFALMAAIAAASAAVAAPTRRLAPRAVTAAALLRSDAVIGWTSAGVETTRPRRRFISGSVRRPESRRTRFTRYGLGTPAQPPLESPLQTQKPTTGLGNLGTEEIPAPAQPEARSRATAYIALGSNMGDRIAMIERACKEMDARGIHVKRTSSLWETEPMYVLDQDRFVNGACEVETDLEPLALLDQLQDIENSMGREKIVDKGPRNIDLDILLYKNEKLYTDRLNLPHIGIPEREFVLRPLAELIPDKPIDPDRPWKLALDYLNELPPPSSPLTTLTPLSTNTSGQTQTPPLQALLPTRRTHVMAILNVTPDSFSDGGSHHSSSSPLSADALATTARRLIDAGATIIDVGGQSTAPRATQVSPAEELARVIPAIEAIRAVNAEIDSSSGASGRPRPRAIISVDTYRASVAAAAVAAGADMVNDVSAGLLDPEMLPTVARLGVTVCLMHMRGTPATMDALSNYNNGSSRSSPSPEAAEAAEAAEDDDDAVIPAIATELLSRVAAAEAAGVRRWRIVLDPGLGFAKVRPGQNLSVLRRLDDLRSWPGLEGLPWLVGPSRKRFVGAVTGVERARDRVWGTAAAVAASVQGGADVVRVHDVGEMSQVVRMADAIWRRR